MVKKGGVTLWIILGIIILLSIALLAYFLMRTTPDIIKIPPDVQPFYDFTSTCLYDITKQGIVKMGIQGGFLTLPPFIQRNPRTHISLSKTIKIPYWYHNAQFLSPKIDYMQRELEIYIDDNIDSCLNDFVDFPELEVQERSELKSRVIFGKNDVIVELDWDVDIKLPDKTEQHVPLLRAEIPVKFRRSYELAHRILTKINDDSFFENITLDLISMHPDVPVDGMEFKCGASRWPIYSVKQDIIDLLKYNIPQTRVKGTDHLPFIEKDSVYDDLLKAGEKAIKALEEDKTPKWPEDTPIDAFYHNSMYLDAGGDMALKAGFQFNPEWGLELDIQPRDGAILKSSLVKGASQYLSFFCINQYHFTYDVVYPIVVTVRDDSAFRGDGFLFQFAFPVILDNNRPKRDFRGYRQFVTDFGSYDYCNKETGPMVDFRATAFEAGIPFAVDQDDVNMTLACGTRRCLLGTTSADEGIFRLRTQIPGGCGNPYIIAEKSGYLPDQQLLLSATDSELFLELLKLKEMNFAIVKHRYSTIDNRLEPNYIDLGRDEKAVIYITLNGHTTDLDQILEYPVKNLDETIFLPEADFEYDITIFVMDAYDEMIAGYDAQDVKITYDQMDGKETMLFHVIEPVPFPKQDLEIAQAIAAMFNTKFTEQIPPTFV
ncbi:hypothetical protein ACFLZN_00095 [Nanoarchaeota archaeon]